MQSFTVDSQLEPVLVTPSSGADGPLPPRPQNCAKYVFIKMFILFLWPVSGGLQYLMNDWRQFCTKPNILQKLFWTSWNCCVISRPAWWTRAWCSSNAGITQIEFHAILGKHYQSRIGQNQGLRRIVIYQWLSITLLCETSPNWLFRMHQQSWAVQTCSNGPAVNLPVLQTEGATCLLSFRTSSQPVGNPSAVPLRSATKWHWTIWNQTEKMNKKLTLRLAKKNEACSPSAKKCSYNLTCCIGRFAAARSCQGQFVQTN